MLKIIMVLLHDVTHAALQRGVVSYALITVLCTHGCTLHADYEPK